MRSPCTCDYLLQGLITEYGMVFVCVLFNIPAIAGMAIETVRLQETGEVRTPSEGHDAEVETR